MKSMQTKNGKSVTETIKHEIDDYIDKKLSVLGFTIDKVLEESG